MSTSAHTDLESGSHSLTAAVLLTPEQAAASLAIGRTKVFELLRSGELESVRIGSCRRIPSEALQAYVSGSAAARPSPRISDISSESPTVLG